MRRLPWWCMLVLVLGSCASGTVAIHLPKVADVPAGRVVVQGQVYGQDPTDPLVLAPVAAYRHGILVAGTETDLSGNYHLEIPATDTATYQLEFAYVGYQTTVYKLLALQPGGAYQLPVSLEPGPPEVIRCFFYAVPLMQLDDTTSGQVFTADQIRHSGVRGR